jgi:DNA invertase Pin-like site-specific DNA recombinase
MPALWGLDNGSEGREPRNMTPICGYVRCSTEEQNTSGLGLAAQRRALEDEASRKGWELSIVEEVASGASIAKRPALGRVLEACRRGEAAGVVVVRVDRLSRSLADFAGLLDDARAHGYSVTALDLGVDLGSPSGELMAGVLATFAQYERRLISERTRAALAEARARGTRLGRPPGTGRPWTGDELAGRIRQMRHQDGLTLQAICDRLNAEGVATARGGARWRPSSLQAVLRAP